MATNQIKIGQKVIVRNNLDSMNTLNWCNVIKITNKSIHTDNINTAFNRKTLLQYGHNPQLSIYIDHTEVIGEFMEELAFMDNSNRGPQSLKDHYTDQLTQLGVLDQEGCVTKDYVKLGEKYFG